MNENEKLINELLNKSQEAFLMAIEIYNKPIIKYRLEGFVFLFFVLPRVIGNNSFYLINIKY